MSKVPCLHWTLTPEVQISLRFTRFRFRFVFQIIEVYGFPIGYNGEIKKKSLKIKNSKFQKKNKKNSTIVRTTEKKIQEKVEMIQ